MLVCGRSKNPTPFPKGVQNSVSIKNVSVHPKMATSAPQRSSHRHGRTPEHPPFFLLTSDTRGLLANRFFHSCGVNSWTRKAGYMQKWPQESEQPN